MSSIEKVSDLLARKAEIALGGGKEKLEKQKQNGSMTARERISALFDEGSFIELGAFVSSRCENTAADGVVTGYGTVDGRLVYAYSQDKTVLSGAIGELNAEKIAKLFDLALKMGAPIVGMLDSDGVRLEEGVLSQAAMGKLLSCSSKASGVIPNVSIVFGTCAGGSAIAAEMSDFVIMNEKSGRLFVNGPSVIEASTGKKSPADAKENVNVSGNAHFLAEDDMGCLGLARLLLSYLPSNNLSDAFEFETADDINRTCDALNNIDQIDDVRIVIAEVADDKAFFESQAGYASEAITGFVRLNGSTVGAIGTNGKELSGKALQKISRFVRFCDCYNIPVLTFTDVDGFVVSAAEEEYGLAKKAATLVYAFTGATVPKVNVIVKKAYGTAYTIMNSSQSGADIVLAYPTAEAAPLNAEAGMRILYNDRLHAGENKDALIEEYKENDASIYNAAKLGYVDDVISPSETRQRVIAAFEMLRSKRASVASRKHDNMPL